jgi:hypothetical protein
MVRTARVVLGMILVFLFPGCATYPGANILRLTDRQTGWDDSGTIARARGAVVELLDHLNIPADRRARFENMIPTKVIRESKYAKLIHITDAVVLTGGDIDIAYANNSIVVARGVAHISHSSNNIVVSADNLDVSHDGQQAGGSLLVAKGTIKIAHARNTIVSSLKGVNISFASGVIAYNTSKRQTSWGSIDNLITKPLFAEEVTAKVSSPMRAAGTDADNKLANESVRSMTDELRASKWPNADVHMVCLYESRSRKVVVEVSRTKKPIILIVCAYEGSVWDVRPTGGAEILQIIATGYHRHQVEGAAVPVATYSYDEMSPFYFYTYDNTMPTDLNIIARVRQLTGKEITSYQGRYGYENQPFTITPE